MTRLLERAAAVLDRSDYTMKRTRLLIEWAEARRSLQTVMADAERLRRRSRALDSGVMEALTLRLDALTLLTALDPPPRLAEPA